MPTDGCCPGGSRTHLRYPWPTGVHRCEPQAEVTGTKVYVNLAMPETAEAVAAQGPDGVGLLRAEFMLTEAFGGRHPRDLIAHGEQNTLVADW